MTSSGFPIRAGLALSTLLLLTACGGGGGGGATSSSSPRLTYQNPAAAAGHYRLVAEPASNGSSHLLLDLIGPSGAQAKGVALFLSAGPAVVWGNPNGAGGAAADPDARAGTAFTLGNPALFKSKLSGNDLQVGLFQTGSAPATLGSAPILTLALDLPAGTASAGTVPLATTSGKTEAFVDGSNQVQPMTLDVGTLTIGM